MAHFVITIGSETHIVFGWDQAEAEETLANKLGVTEQEFYDSIRPATVRETLADEYGVRWSTQMNHVVTYHEGSYSTNDKDIVVINDTKANDRQGYDDAVEVSNHRVLCSRWSHLEGLSRGPWSNCDVIALELDLPAPEDLTDVIGALEGYPVLDEDVMSEVEQEMLEEHWVSYGRNDTMDAVAKAIGADNRSDLTEYAEELVWTLVWEGVLTYGAGGGYPTMIDVSAVDFGTDEVAAWVKARLGLVVPVKTHGRTKTFAILRNNLLEKDAR